MFCCNSSKLGGAVNAVETSISITYAPVSVGIDHGHQPSQRTIVWSLEEQCVVFLRCQEEIKSVPARRLWVHLNSLGEPVVPLEYLY